MGHVNKNLERDVENQAPNFGMPRELEARFARSALGGDTLGLSLMRLAPGFRSRSATSTRTRRRSTSSCAARPA